MLQAGLNTHTLYLFSSWSCEPIDSSCENVGPATTQNLVVKFDGEIRGGVLVENASEDFPQQKKLENLLPNFAGSSPPISPKTSPTSLWKSLVPKNVSGPEKGVITKGVLSLEEPLESLSSISTFSRISRKMVSISFAFQSLVGSLESLDSRQ